MKVLWDSFCQNNLWDNPGIRAFSCIANPLAKITPGLPYLNLPFFIVKKLGQGKQTYKDFLLECSFTTEKFSTEYL